jgi:CBS domain-containing protein
MQASDIMTTSVETVRPETPVSEIAGRLLARHVSAVPVVDEDGHVVGIVSEGDLMRRPESGTERVPSWWLRIFDTGEGLAREFVKSHGMHARDVMTRSVVTVDEGASIEEIAQTLESKRIKRVPVLRDGKLTGIVSRADLLRGLAASGTGKKASIDDRDARAAIVESARDAGVDMEFASVVVVDGVANVWGLIETGAQKNALRVAAESTPGISRVNDQVTVMSDALRSTIRAI